MSEVQYQPHFDLPRHELGVMANERWCRDPKLLGITLSRYKFVSKMLSGKNLVAEVGAGDGWFSRVVEKEVGKLWLFDFDHALIDDNIKRGGYTLFHNILDGVLPNGPFDAIYSMDVMEHINDQPRYLRNICNSMTKDGVFIVGLPSIESQQYASEPSKVGHIGCLTYNQLKEKLECCFHNVFIFTLNDEQIGLSFEKMAHYFMALCVGIR